MDRDKMMEIWRKYGETYNVFVPKEQPAPKGESWDRPLPQVLRSLFLLQAADKAAEIARYGRLKGNLFAAERMNEGNGRGMQSKTFVRSLPFSISVVTHHRVSDAREMYARLMLSPCQQINFEQGKVRGLLEDLVSRMG
jgi:hypothetical protein